MLQHFEQHQKEVKALRLLEQQEDHSRQNINLINEMPRVILHRYCKKNWFINLKKEFMKLFILYQTDIWKSKVSRVWFGFFNIRKKAIDSVKYNGLYCSGAEVVIEKVTLNLFEEN